MKRANLLIAAIASAGFVLRALALTGAGGPAVAITIIGFVASSSYWTQYNSHLAASECVLAGIGAAALFESRRVFAFDPTWALTAGHLPPHGDGAGRGYGPTPRKRAGISRTPRPLFRRRINRRSCSD